MVINKYLAEFIGTFILVMLGSMAILASSTVGVPLITVPFGFGLALLAGIYAVGHVSGGHFNPAVTLAMYVDKRTSATDLIGYWIAQFAGATFASLILWAGTDRAAVGQTATLYNGEVGLGIMSEVILTAVFVLVILASTKTAPATAGIAISLTLVGVHFAGIPFSGASVNPARSFGPAVVGSGSGLGELWVYLVFPLVGGLIAVGLWQLFRPGAAVLDIDVDDDGMEVDDLSDLDSEPHLPEPGADIVE